MELLDRELLHCPAVHGGDEPEPEPEPAGPGDHYDHPASRYPVAHMSAATLISSRLVNVPGQHAPALDVDWPVRCTASAQTGQRWVWVHGLDEPRWWAATEAFAAAGLAHGDLPAGDTHRDDDGAVGRVTAALQVLGPLHQGRFPDLVATAAAAATVPARGARTVQVSDLKASGWFPFAFISPALVVASSSNHHLYVEQAVPWPTYRRLLDQLAQAGLIEPGYVGASVARVATHLRVPWVHKPHTDLAAAAA